MRTSLLPWVFMLVFVRAMADGFDRADEVEDEGHQHYADADSYHDQRGRLRDVIPDQVKGNCEVDDNGG